MSSRDEIRKFKLWEKVLYFFPVQLLFVHLKKNLLLLVFWVILFAIVTKTTSVKYGVPYLFLYPEYLGEVNFLSHFIVGLVTGGFIMAFNISSYVVNGFRFPFLATLSRPFIKYCQNNLIIPLLYTAVYCYFLARFQIDFEKEPSADVMRHIAGFLLGNLAFIALTAGYFMATNKNVFSFLPKHKATPSGQYINPVRDLFSNQRKWERHPSIGKQWRVVSYISNFGRIALARSSKHYKVETLEKVFSQNRINASVFQVVVIGALFVLGWFHETSWLIIPAAASLLLFFTVFIMVVSAFYSWFKGWATVALLLAFLILNSLTRYDLISYENQAYGLDYNAPPTPYTQETIRKLQENRQNLYLDVENGHLMLENWKRKTGQKKPVAVFVNVPGGGLRSAMWSIEALSHADSASHGALWPHTLMISGSSGGMLGAAYLREFKYRKMRDSLEIDFHDISRDMGRDKLNPVTATAVLNDLFFRFRTFEYQGMTYTKDRARAFENQVNADTRGWLNKKLWDYNQLELNADIPMLVLSPTVSADGRKLIIASQPVSYLCHNDDELQINENIEFTRFFNHHNARNISFLSALRMSATFPYVFPAARLPTSPPIEILDAGIRDNYGMSNTLNFIYFFRNWLMENTSKVVILQLRDQQKFHDIKASKRPSLLQELTQPFGTFYNTVLDIQDYQMDDDLRIAHAWYAGDLEVIDLVLARSETNPISLSWHLTNKEKLRIRNSIHSDYNHKQFLEIRHLLKPKS